ncbi:MAG: alpha/beta hydrolase [bacterium]|nr:alpha/beta hydrolase [bacterium]
MKKKILLVCLSIPLLLLIAPGLVGLFVTPELRVKPGYERRFLELNGARIGYVQIGQGPDVLLLHGAMGSVEDWTPLIRALGDSHRLTILDRPGFVRSTGGPEHKTLVGNADVAAAAIHALELEQPLLVGHSHGGSIALVFAVRHPRAARGVLTLDTSGPGAYKPGLNDFVLTLPYAGRGLAILVGALVGPNMIRSNLEQALAPRMDAMPPGFVSFRMKLWAHADSLVAFALANRAAPAEFEIYADRFASLEIPLSMAYCQREAQAVGVAVRTAFAEGLASRAAAVVEKARANPAAVSGVRAVDLLRLRDCNHYVQYTNAAEIAGWIRRLTAP